MQLQLSEQQLSGARRALLGPASADLIDLVFRLDTRQPVDGKATAARTTAAELGWLERDGRSFTSLGWLVADTVRECRFWLERDLRANGVVDRSRLGLKQG